MNAPDELSLEVPVEAVRRASAALGDVREMLASAGPFIVAVELRREAVRLQMCAELSARVDVNRTHLFDAQVLRERAAELDGGAK